MKKKLVFILMCCITLTGFVFAQNKPGNENGSQKPPQGQTQDQGSGGVGAGVQVSTAKNIAELARELKQFTITQEEANRLMEALGKDTRNLELARAEIKEMQAKLSRLLLEEKPNRQEIEKTVRQSVEVEYRIRMIQIERSLAVREILGQERWSLVIRVMRQLTVSELKKEEIQDLVKLGVNAETLRLLFAIVKAMQ